MDGMNEDDASPLHALGLHRVGQPPPPRPPVPPVPVLNKRGMPIRIRKKNPMYFDEALLMSPKHPRMSPRKSPKLTYSNTPKKRDSSQHTAAPSGTIALEATVTGCAEQDKEEVEHTIELDDNTLVQTDMEPPNMMQLNLECSSSSNGSNSSIAHSTGDTDSVAERVVVQHNGVRLRNFLKLPQAHKWIYYEWFYANIDQPLFLGRNDFEQVLNEAFPQLKARQITRRQWSLVRKIMGKPRRCSQSFFSEEISSLSKRRQVLRLLQQRKITDVSSQLRDLPFTLPHHIPCQLVIGTKVTARIRKPENGLYMGRIDAVDTSNNTYRVSFVRHGIGTHSIPDYEVLSCELPEMMPLASFQHKFRPRPPLGLVTPPRPLLPRLHSTDSPNSHQLLGIDSPACITNDPVLAQSPRHPPPVLTVDDSIGEYPVESLMHIVQLWQLLESKAEKVKQLETLNSGAEKLRCIGEEVSGAFQRRYATLVLDVEHLNAQLNKELLQVHTFCQEISGGSSAAAAPRLLPRQIQERCMAEAVAVVQVGNTSTPDALIGNNALHLVTALTALMLQIKNLGDNEVSAFELTSLQDTINNLREEVEDKDSFRDLVDVPLTHIMAAASQLGPLTAFTTARL